MRTGKIRISGTGCALADFLYDDVSFETPEFRQFLSKETGDGGLNPGGLVFTEELEKFTGMRYTDILKRITGGYRPSAFNVGGPGLVSMIHTSQMLGKDDFEVRFFGIAGNDEISRRIFQKVSGTPVNIVNYLSSSLLQTPSTDVFSDRRFSNFHGERTFVNTIGAAWDYYPENLDDEFFNSDIVCFGGTALVPNIHDNLTGILEKAKQHGCITIVNTVYDFRSEKTFPGKPWPLGKEKKCFHMIDLLVMDAEEARKISGTANLKQAAAFFIASGVSSFIITNGPDDVLAWSDGGLFSECSLMAAPVSGKVMKDLRLRPGLKGDTTGCGDNFTGGVIASVALQMREKHQGELSLQKALALGVASGGFCCYMLGGTFIEKYPGEKRELIMQLYDDYLKQIS